jgi:uncharacterized protein YndB with AHSA1/START domain
VSGDQARVSVAVAVEPAAAFEIFTAEIDQWWRRGPKYRHSGTRSGIIHIEPRVGGRLFESFGTETGTSVIEVGRVRVWTPPERLVFSWRNANFAENETTEVEVEFTPSASGTLVVVTHRGWSALRHDHPARHGLAGADFSRMIGLWWGEQLTALRQQAARAHS